ncbi:hypothetical protein [Macrococcoides caseolyticum]|nr:hypothetical protein [Macrococcus caseolyticus]
MENKSFFEQFEENISKFIEDIGKATGFIKLRDWLTDLINRKGE